MATPRTLLTLVLGLLTIGPTVFSQAPAPSGTAAEPLRGFAPARAASQRDAERTMQSMPSAERITEWHRYFTSVPHPATSPRTKEIAERIAQAWRDQGLEDVDHPPLRRAVVEPARGARGDGGAARATSRRCARTPYPEDPDTAHKDISSGVAVVLGLR